MKNKTPFETVFGNKPNVKNLKIYGSKVFERKPEALRKRKWDDKAQLGILVGYTYNDYRVLLNNKIINARQDHRRGHSLRKSLGSTPGGSTGEDTQVSSPCRATGEQRLCR